MEIFLQSVCIGLIPIGLGFIFIDLRTRLDSSFTLFGITLVLLSVFTSFDVFYYPAGPGIIATSFQHVVFLSIPPFIVWYLSVLRKESQMTIIKILMIAGLTESIFFVSGQMFTLGNDQLTSPTLLYYLVFFPYFATAVSLILWMVFKKKTNEHFSPEYLITVHQWGFIFLIACGFYDLLQLAGLRAFGILMPSATFLAVIVLQLLLGWLFTERLILLIKENQSTLEKLTGAYKEVEDARTLSELGRSTAIINHEIRNFATTIQTGAELLLDGDEKFTPEKRQKILHLITATVKQLTTFSSDVLDFTKSKIIKDKAPIDIVECVRKTVSNHFPTKETAFDFTDFTGQYIVHGDWGKLEHVFFNLFKNAFEAGAKNIALHITSSSAVTLISVEDDGPGFPDNPPSKLFEAFFSTKGRSGGTGLGLSITRSIIESHGGNIAARSKNAAKDDEITGLIFSISFPDYSGGSSPAMRTDSGITLLSENLVPLEPVLKIFKNVLIEPRVVTTITAETFDQLNTPGATIIGCPAQIANLTRHKVKTARFVTIAAGKFDTPYATVIPDGSPSGVFCEEFLLALLKETKEQPQ